MAWLTLSCSAFSKELLAPADGQEDAASAASAASAAPKSFTGIAYSGGMMTNHGPFGTTAIDLASLIIPDKPLFALVNHDPNLRAGIVTPRLEGDGVVVDGYFMTTPAGMDVANEFAQGAPWEFSVRVNGQVTSFPTTTRKTVNGREMELDSLLQHTRIREVSFVPAGADPHTRAIAFSMENTMTDELDAAVAAPNEGNPASPAPSEPSATKSLQDELDAVKADNEKLKQQLADALSALDAIKSETRTSEVKATFALMQRDYNDDLAAAYLTMADQAFAMWRADIQSMAALPVDASLTTEQAQAGADPDITPLRRKVAELLATDPGVTYSQAVARVLHQHPELYSDEAHHGD